MIMAPNPNTTQQMTMDNVPATSHIIGRDHPTPGDFAAAIHGVSRTEVAGMTPPPMPANGMMPQGVYAPYMNQQQQPMMMPQVPQKNMYARIADELKTPILVSILVFVFSLPFLNILFSHYAPGDFAAAIHGVSRTEVAGMTPPPMPANGMMPQGVYAPYMNQQQQPMMMPQVPQKNMYARIADELKTPILVSILVFVFSLPFLNILFSHYAPMLLKPTGDLTSVGLLLKAVAAGAAFWVLQRVIAPLVSL